MSDRRTVGPVAWASLAALLTGLLVAFYLTVVHYRMGILVCAVGGDCHTVQTSKYATVGTIPVAVLGLVLMATVLGLWLLRALDRLDEFTATALIFVLLFTGLVCEGYLTYVEIWVLDAICAWCVTFAAALGFAAILEAIHLLQIEPE